MELQSLQSQLKTAIQNHQIVLSKMRIDPQNSALQRQLHDLQAEIMTLSDKQKQVVQQLRTELERKQSSTVLKLTHNAQFLPRGMLGGVPVKLQAALKGGSGGVLLPQVVVVPSCSSGSSPSPTLAAPHQGGPSPLPTLLAPPPIRVPQYPPPCGQRLAPQPAPHPHQHPHQQKQHTVVTTPTSVPPRIPKPCVAVLVQANSVGSTGAGLVVPSHGSSVHGTGGSSGGGISVATTGCVAAGTTTATPVTAATTPAPVPTPAGVPPRRATPAPPSTPAPPPNKEDHLKLELLGALGLMTREALRELQHRRGERKRRTTANPHFSNAALEEKRRNALLLITGDNLATSTTSTTKGRQKGRARLDSSTPSSPEGSSSENTPNGHPSPPPPPPPPPPLPAPSPCFDVVIKKEEAPPMVNGDVFRDWTRCATKEVTSSAAALGWVSDYAVLKSAKAEEKQKLLKRSLELKAERMQLEEKKQQLSEIIANQQKRRVELQQALQSVQASLEKFEHVVKLFKEPS